MSQKYLIIDEARDLNPRALSFLIELDQNHFPTPWSKVDWNQLFNISHRFLILIEDEAEILGFALFETAVADSFAHLLKIIVNPNKRRKNIGKNLLREALRELLSRGIKSFFLEVEEDNMAAIKVYESQGFKTIHLKKQFYSSGANALIMTLDM